VKSTVKVGLFYSESVEDFCCGLIQGGSTNRACCKAVDKCTTQSQKDNKAIILNGCFHIRGIKANQLLIEPSLDGYRLPKVKLNDLINEKWQSNVWIAYIENENIAKIGKIPIEGLETDETEEWEDVDMSTL
jgi:hypothetical protein